jgi:hypothetical protein
MKKIRRLDIVQTSNATRSPPLSPEIGGLFVFGNRSCETTSGRRSGHLLTLARSDIKPPMRKSGDRVPLGGGVARRMNQQCGRARCRSG